MLLPAYPNSRFSFAIQLFERLALQTPLLSAASIHREVFVIAVEQINANFDNADLRVASHPENFVEQVDSLRGIKMYGVLVLIPNQIAQCRHMG